MKNIDSLIIIQAFFVTLFLLFVLRPVSKKIGLTDKPNARKKHEGEIPLIGGLSIYLCLLALFYWLPVKNYAYLISATLLVACGTIDDFKPLSYKIRLIIEVVAALIVIQWGGIEIKSLGNIFGFGEVSLGYFSPVFTVFAIIGGINAFNMIDGIDGLAGSLSLLVFILIFIVGLNTPSIVSLCLIFIPAICAFLLFNLRILGRKKASIFLGDSGSMLFGFTISCLVILASQNENRIISPATVLWVLAIPLFDSISIMVRRIKKGKSPFSPDREHFHHILPLAGYSINQTICIILTLSFGLGCFGIIGEILINLPDWLLFYLFLGLFFLFFWGMSHSWKMMKIARILRFIERRGERRKTDRRKNTSPYYGVERRVLPDRRSGLDRRKPKN
jgi:UDP-GlcNAc:undecaprenyl-phosphate GlcNAc-1-phosphate transferase